MVTKGGVAFLSGTLDYFARAYDVTTEKQLWESAPACWWAGDADDLLVGCKQSPVRRCRRGRARIHRNGGRRPLRAAQVVKDCLSSPLANDRMSTAFANHALIRTAGPLRGAGRPSEGAPGCRRR